MVTPLLQLGRRVLLGAGALGLAVALVGLAGCRAAPDPVAQPFEIDAREYARVFEAAVMELRDLGFVIDRLDYRFGRITTEPQGAATLLEPWDPVHTELGQAAAATLADTRRTVRVMLDPADVPPQPGTLPPAAAAGADPAAYALRVEVLMHRRQVPIRRLDGSADRNVFNTLSALPPDWEQRGIEAQYWQPVGRDAMLEDRLIAAIVRRSLVIDPAGREVGPGGAGGP